jgi:hypothetical protein
LGLSASRRCDRLVVKEDATRRAIEILKLTSIERPEEGKEPAQAERQRDRDEQKEATHGRPRPSLRALPTTIKDELDIASAARSGVTMPSIASGTASAL